MDLSKAYDCLPHDLLIAKLEAYGLGYNSLRFLYSYLSNRSQRVRISSSVSDCLAILLGVPQGSILGPILFNIFINDLLFSNLESDICNFADDNTLYARDSSIDNVLLRLNSDIPRVMDWFRSNEMVVNPDKFQVMFLGIENSRTILIDNHTITTSAETVKLLGITIDRKLTFQPHITDVYNVQIGKLKHSWESGSIWTYLKQS